jgi:hypothetical protein
MAYLTKCRFCGGETLNHDHDECAEKFGSNLRQRILDHTIKSPDVPLPSAIISVLKSDRWKKWYLEYLERKQKNEEMQQHMNTMRKKITEEAQKILTSKSSQKYLNRHNVEFNWRTFTVSITPTVSVTVNPVC